MAPWPTDLSKYLEMEEKMWAGIDEMIKKGQMEEFGVFPEAHCGYAIGKGETADVYRTSCMFHPYVLAEIHEIIPYEKHKEILREVLKARIAAMKK